MRWLVPAALVVAGCGGEPPQCGTSVAEDLFIVTAIDSYNHALGPAQTGATWSCPGGGTATVSGMSTQPDPSTRVDDYLVTYDSCFDSAIDTKLTFSGVVHQTGTWVLDLNAYYCHDCRITADALAIKGTETHCDEPKIDRTCMVDFTVHGTAANAPQQYAGSICDFTFP